ncbi:unnamed protein product [Effrenium voratum]|uniref:L-type lectin-like domain-containing protein n=1 Tax=Effrenium voratum TaxID=2562239 RepID=A0AA36IY22_9DINO|nr:unnamed protein product [Effrenium voratum]CAJ1462282.1 unnamed protein product [Effrenium voratum]
MRCPKTVLLLLPLALADPSPLPGHSMSSPPEINHLAKTWLLTGTTMPSHNSLILTPGVADRVGTAFSRTPLRTNDFEVEFTISAKPGTAVFENDGVAFWYSEENSTEILVAASAKHSHNQDELIAGTWYDHYVQQGLGLYGFKSAFKGLGVFFSRNAGAATVGLKFGDGSGASEGPEQQLEIRDGKDHSVKLRVQPEAATLQVDAVTLTLAKPAKAGGFMGFSCYGGSKASYNPKERSAFVEIKGVKVMNYASGPGEDTLPSAAEPEASKEKEDVLGAHSSFKDHREESEAIKELTNMVFKLVIESKPQREQMKAAISALSKRVSVVEESFTTLKKEIDMKTGHNLGEEFESIKKELADMHAAAHRDTDARGKKLADLHSDIEHVQKTAATGGDISGDLDSLSRSNEQVLDELTSQHKRMFGVSIFAIAFIIIAGLSLYNKFRCWEKKHVL